MVDKFFQELILDDFFQCVFGADGWLSCIWGSWIAIFVLYLLPLDKDARLNILTKIFQHWIPIGRKDAVKEHLNEILYQPGGIWKVDPKWCQTEENISFVVDQDTTSQTLENDLELTWDAETESLNASEMLYHPQLHRNEPSFKENPSVISLVSSPPLATIEKNGIQPTRVRSTESSQSTSVQSRNDSTSNNTTKIVLDVIRFLLRRRMMEIEEEPLTNKFTDVFISKIGMISSALLLAQLRYCPKSRRTLWTIGHFGITLGLVTISAGSCGTWYCRKKFDRWIQDIEGHDFKANVDIMNSFHNSAKNFFSRMKSNPKLRRKFQG
eukprot:CAMPEP_0176494656 /NCGR_PEP_ID=MMETSP0200_2-20121128/10226_1 /TAXON_ID=947934 /ORGANISM="Chaetoceros sp., Strain GSL56" /LENGTH=324 /DNA_ID=CAMNT_0017892455 /DNA_START=264 /DNA_END=1235 /DNA_ORIENTATION=+